MRTQIIHDHNGIPTGVFIPIEDWEDLKRSYPSIDRQDDFELTQETKNMLDARMSDYLQNPDDVQDFDDLLDELEREL